MQTPSISSQIKRAPEDPIDIQIFMDSNRKFIDEKCVSPDGRLKTKISPCGSISDLGKLVNSIPENLKALLIHTLLTGVNDIEFEPDVNQIHSKLYGSIMKIRDLHPNLKIILSEITAKFDSLDKDVLRLNAKIFNSFKACENLFVVHNNNLRKEASNMKFGMRKVLMLGDHRDKQVDNPARNYASLRSLMRSDTKKQEDMKNQRIT